MGMLMDDAKIRSSGKGNAIFAREDKIFCELDQQFLRRDRYYVFDTSDMSDIKRKCRLMD